MILSLPNATGDVALTHDGVGTAFAAVCNGADIWLDRMSGAAWDTMALQIPPVNAASGNPDRPFLLGDRRTSEVLFLSWGDSSPAQGTLAEFSYSTGSALSTTNGAWCPQYTLPSTVGCAAIFGSSCQMVQDSAGDVWIAIPGDRDCDQQSPLDGIVSPIGVRRFVGDTNICSNAVEAPLSAPECLYVSTGAPVDLSRTEPPDLEFKHFTLSLSAAGDSPRLNLAFYAFRELATGRPCPASGSSICRSDVLHVQRSPSGLWCNPQGACQDPNRTCGHNASCGIHVADLDTGELNPIFTVANADPPGRSSHILPAVVSLDYGQLAAHSAEGDRWDRSIVITGIVAS